MNISGLPLLSHPPPDNSDGSEETTCRKCNKEFNFLFARQKRCNHCGYAYCSSCADFQALMPRGGPESGYEVHPVCAYCMDMLTVTASSRSKLRSLPLAKLRGYMKAYDIATGSGALEKEDLVNAIMRARGTNGCLLPVYEEYYRNNSVPRKPSERQRSRSFFSRPARSSTPPPPPPPMASQRQNARPSPSSPSHARTGPTRPVQPQFHSAPAPHAPHFHSQPYDHNPHPTQSSSSYYRHMPSSQQQYYHPPPSRFMETNFRPSASQTNLHAQPSSYLGEDRPRQAPEPPPRPRSAAPSVPVTRNTPQVVPSLESLLDKTPDEISHLSISVLKAVLFENRVNSSTGVLEKEDLVRKVLALVKDEKRDREIAEREEREEAERMEWARREREMQEEERRAEERGSRLSEGRFRQERDHDPDEELRQSAAHELGTASMPDVPFSEKTQDGLCVVCCDAHANMAIIDCGHLALCKACSEIVMKTSRECPLCRTRIVTEQRLLRIFKT